MRGFVFGHHSLVEWGTDMDFGEWPSDWMFYAGNNTALGADLFWLGGLTVLLWLNFRQRA